MLNEVYNANPVIFAPSKASSRQNFKQKQSIWLDDAFDAEDDGLEEVEEIDSQEIFDLIRSISDPEHPLSLEQLAVVSEPQVHLEGNRVLVEFTPTVPHCGMSTLIGLSIRVRLIRSLPQRFKIDVRVKPGTHQSEHALNKQLNDKERVAAALENHALLEVLERCLATAGQRGQPA